MKEEDIRPELLLEEEKRIREKDIKKILEKKKNFINITCPGCETNDFFDLFRKDGFNFVKCRKCKTVFINPRPSPEILYDFYVNSLSIKYWNDFIFPKTDESRRKNIFTPRAKRVIELCDKYNVKKKKIIDVGAGFGTFCEEIIKFNYFNSVIAIEPSSNLAETCRKKKIEVIELPIEKIELKEVNVITNFELIEHLFWPKDFLISCFNALDKDGLLIITTPNINGFDLMVLGNYSDNVGGPNHLNYFNIESLKFLLEKCKFKVIEILTPGKLDSELVRKKILNKTIDISNQPFLEYILVKKWDLLGKNFQDFLSNNLLSSHLWIVAKK